MRWRLFPITYVRSGNIVFFIVQSERRRRRKIVYVLRIEFGGARGCRACMHVSRAIRAHPTPLVSLSLSHVSVSVSHSLYFFCMYALVGEKQHSSSFSRLDRNARVCVPVLLCILSKRIAFLYVNRARVFFFFSFRYVRCPFSHLALALSLSLLRVSIYA